MLLVADINIPYLKGVFEPFFDVKYLSGNAIDSDVAHNADVLVVRTRTKCNEQLLAGSTVKFIASATIGTDHIDTDYCLQNGIGWANAPGSNSRGVQQWVGSVLAYWAQKTGRSLNGLTLGVVGVGNVGKKIVKLGNILGLNVLCCDPPRVRTEGLTDFIDLSSLVTKSDIVTFHVPLSRRGSDATYHFVNSDVLNLCKKDALIINSSRGEVVETQALLKFLSDNSNVNAALDVWENEPQISANLVNRSMVATTHIAGYSLEGKVNATTMVVNAVSKFFNLNLHPWTPNPNPLDSKVEMSYSGDLLGTLFSTYNIMSDDIRNIRKSFEEYRNTYNYRRDYSGYVIKNVEEKLTPILEELAFEVNRE
ncbi:MAG TPA: 4-phosphoerythronate dehydrogenase [Tenuifilaceae bacterium]|nr:4-phosphoerythronate dehydrogenase [Tenuifilaceae bacterium]